MNYVQITQRGLTGDLVDFEGTQLSVSTYENPTALRRTFQRLGSEIAVHGVPQVRNGPTLSNGDTPSIVSSDIVLIKKVQTQ